MALLLLVTGHAACSVPHDDSEGAARATAGTARSAYIEFLWKEADWTGGPPLPRPISVVVKDDDGTVVVRARAEPEDTRPGTGFWRLHMADDVLEHQAEPTLIISLPAGSTTIEVEADGCAPESLSVLPDDGMQVHVVVLRPK